MGSVLGAAMLGLRDAIYGRTDNEVAIVQEAGGDPPDEDLHDIRLDPDHPERSEVVVPAVAGRRLSRCSTAAAVGGRAGADGGRCRWRLRRPPLPRRGRRRRASPRRFSGPPVGGWPAGARRWVREVTRAGIPARLTGRVQRATRRSLASSKTGGKIVRVGMARRSTRLKTASMRENQRAWAVRAADSDTWSDASRPRWRRSRTSSPMPSGWVSARRRLVFQASAVEQEAAGGARPSPIRACRSSTTSHPVAARARSMAASILGSASIRMRPTRQEDGRGSRRIPVRAEPYPISSPPTSRAMGPMVSKLGDRGQTPSSGDPAPGRLQPGRAATGRRDPDRPAGVAAVGDVGLAGGHGHRRPARRATGDAGGVEGIHRGPEPRVDPGHAEGELVEVGPTRRSGPRPPGPRPGRRRRPAPARPDRPPPGSRPWSGRPPCR